MQRKLHRIPQCKSSERDEVTMNGNQQKRTETIKERTISIMLSDEDCERLSVLCGRHGLSAGSLIENFIGDLIGSSRSNGSDERAFAQRWFERCWFGMDPEYTLLNHFLSWGFEPEEYLKLLDNIAGAYKDKEYFEKHPDETTEEEIRFLLDDIEGWTEELKEMEEDWKPENTPNMEEEIALIRSWVEEKERLIAGKEGEEE